MIPCWMHWGSLFLKHWLKISVFLEVEIENAAHWRFRVVKYSEVYTVVWTCSQKQPTKHLQQSHQHNWWTTAHFQGLTSIPSSVIFQSTQTEGPPARPGIPNCVVSAFCSWAFLKSSLVAFWRSVRVGRGWGLTCFLWGYLLFCLVLFLPSTSINKFYSWWFSHGFHLLPGGFHPETAPCIERYTFRPLNSGPLKRKEFTTQIDRDKHPNKHKRTNWIQNMQIQMSRSVGVL